MAVFDFTKLISDFTADVGAIGADRPGGEYDRINAWLRKKNILPDTPQQKLAIIATLLLASRAAQQKFAPLGPVANFVQEIALDTVREEAKRVLWPVQPMTVVVKSPSPASPRRAQRAPVSAVVVRSIHDLNAFLFPWMSNKRGR